MDGPFYMKRCLELAAKGAADVSPNPMVGALLVCDDQIIGEGWHEKFGEAHAEVNAVNNAIRAGNEKLLTRSALYVNLEPCSHVGKTPPCTDLIIQHGIPEVVTGVRDPFEQRAGRGLEKLRSAGVQVKENILEKECRELNKRFFVYHEQQRPYVILKWAQTSDQFMAALSEQRLLISNAFTNREVHKWRSEEASVLVGTKTALADDPALTNRNWSGPSPVRLVIDMDLSLPTQLQLFNGKQKTIVFNSIRHDESGNPAYWKLTKDGSLVKQILKALYDMKIQSTLVEGGARLLQSFIDENIWDEVRVITNKELTIGSGLKAPQLPRMISTMDKHFGSDLVEIFKSQ